MSKLAIARAQAAIDTYKATTEYEGDESILLWHLVFDLLEWCDSKRYEFDQTVESVRAEYATAD